MVNKNIIFVCLVAWGFFLTFTPDIALTQEAKIEIPIVPVETNQYQKIEQPLSLKLAVALGGLGLIGAELWWFMFSKVK